MSQQPLTPDDPRLTAYVLGELSGAERAAVEAHLAACAESRRVVDELRDTTARLFEALQAEPSPALTDAQRESIQRAAMEHATPPAREVAIATHPAAQRTGVSRTRAAATAMAAVVTVSAAALVVLLRPWDTASSPSTADIARLHVEQEQLLAWNDPAMTGELSVRQDAQLRDLSSLNRYHFVPTDNPHVAKDNVQQFEATPQPPVDSLTASTDKSGVGPKRSLDRRPGEPAPPPSSGEGKIIEGLAADASRPSINASRPLSITQPIEESAPALPAGVVDAPYGRTAGPLTPPPPTTGKGLAQQTGNGRAIAGVPRLQQKQSSGRGGPVTSAPQPGYSINTHGNPAGSPASTISNSAVSGNENGQPSVMLGVRAGQGQPLSESGPTPDQLDRPAAFGGVAGAPYGSAPIGETAVPQAFSAGIDVPFRQGSFELGIPENERLSELSVMELNQLHRTGRWRWYEPRPARRHLGTEQYAPIVENPFVSPADQPLSTFGLDVDTASYANVRRFLMDQHCWPPADAVRIEELINYFSYADPQPDGEHPLRVTLEAAACPWAPAHRLVRIGIKGREIDLADRPPTSLVFLIDTSGSMRDENKLPLVKQSLRLLARNMTENDRIALVTYSTTAGLLLDSTSGEHADAIMRVIDSLDANGSTNGEAGLKLAYEIATRHFIENGSNRVILCTDGDFNVGESADAPLVRMISQKRDTGVFLSICGFGTGNLKDAKLEQIADHGNGQYHYIDGIEQARKVFLNELSGMLYTIARDVKLQVEFNPAHVDAYRLLGYENRALAAEDFNNDRIDAGDLGAGHSVTALYEIVPPGAVRAKPASETPGVDPLKYQGTGDRRQESGDGGRRSEVGGQRSEDGGRRSEVGGQRSEVGGRRAEVGGQRSEVGGRRSEEHPTSDIQHQRSPLNAQRSTELLTVKLRYKQPRSNESVKLEFPLVDDADAASASADLEWAAAVASFGMILRNSAYRGQSSIEGVLELARGAKGHDPTGDRQEFIDMVLEARHLLRKATGRTDTPPPELTSLEAREKASVGGRYRELLDKFARPEDFHRYGAFHDAGYKRADRDGKHPAGYWVYVYPHWYIWGETTDVSAVPDALRTP